MPKTIRPRGLNKANKVALLRKVAKDVAQSVANGYERNAFLCAVAGKFDKQSERVYRSSSVCIPYGPCRAYMQRLVAADGIALNGCGFFEAECKPELVAAALAQGLDTENGRRLVWVREQIAKLEGAHA